MVRRHAFGSTGLAVPVIGQGTANLHRASRDEAVRALRHGLDLGLSHIDTAEAYAVEEWVGEAIAGRRSEVFLASKVLPGHADRDGLRRACEASLKRLRTERLDLYLLHWPSDVPAEETVEAFERLVEEGKIAAWGVSNFDVDELRAMVALAGPGRVSCDQVLHHLGERYAEGTLAQLCAAQRIALVGYSPFAAGAFPVPPAAGAADLFAVARAHDATPRQVALAFLTRLPGTFAIPKAQTLAHLDENAAAATLTLSPEEIARLDAAFPIVGSHLPLPRF